MSMVECVMVNRICHSNPWLHIHEICISSSDGYFSTHFIILHWNQKYKSDIWFLKPLYSFDKITSTAAFPKLATCVFQPYLINWNIYNIFDSVIFECAFYQTKGWIPVIAPTVWMVGYATVILLPLPTIVHVLLITQDKTVKHVFVFFNLTLF